MRSVLRIRVDRDWVESGGTAPLRWTIAGQGGITVRSGVAKSAAELPACNHVELVAPASAALLTNVKAPGKTSRRFMKTLRFAVEEQIITDPWTVHVAAGPADGDSLPVAVIDRDWMRRALNTLADNGVHPRAFLLETLLAPFKEEIWSVALSGDGAALRTGLFSGSALDPAENGSLPPLLEIAMAEARNNKTEPRSISVYITNGTPKPDVALWEERLGVPVKVESAQEPVESGINLLQGEFAPAMRLKSAVPHLKIPAALLVLAALFHVASYFVEWSLMKSEEARLNKETADMFRSAFPETPSVADPAAALSAKIQEMKKLAGEGGEAGEFLGLTGKALSLMPEGAALRAVDYSSGRLDMKMVFQGERDSKTFDDLLSKEGVKVTRKEWPDEEKGFPSEISVTLREPSK